MESHATVKYRQQKLKRYQRGGLLNSRRISTSVDIRYDGPTQSQIVYAGRKEQVFLWNTRLWNRLNQTQIQTQGIYLRIAEGVRARHHTYHVTEPNSPQNAMMDVAFAWNANESGVLLAVISLDCKTAKNNRLSSPTPQNAHISIIPCR